jgi:hypothetical protein
MKYPIALAASIFLLIAVAPIGFAQTSAGTAGALAPTRNPQHPTSSESLQAQAQDLTTKIQEAKTQGRDTDAAASEQAQGEQAMQQGKSQEALRHFEAGERDLATSAQSQSPTR